MSMATQEVPEASATAEFLDRWRLLVDAAPLGVRRELVAEVDRFAEQVEDAPERRVAHGDHDRRARVDHLRAARETVGRVHRHRAHAVIAQVLLHLAHEHGAADLRACALGLLRCRGRRPLDHDRVVDLGQALVEDGVDDDAADLLDATDVLRALLAGGGAARLGLGARGCALHQSVGPPVGLVAVRARVGEELVVGWL